MALGRARKGHPAGRCLGNIAPARELHGVPATQSEPTDGNAGELAMIAHPCPCCGGPMIIIETFERGSTPRTRPTSPIRIDTS